MSDKPSPKPPAAKSPAKPADNGTTVGTKASPDKAKPEDGFDFLAPPQDPGELGRLGHYRVLKVLGKGGMGIVFMAEDTRLHRIVALKVMLPAIAKKEIARDRFLREAQATAKIEHDHIVTIYEVNEDNGVPFLAMQFLRGMTLDDWLRAGKSLNIPQIMRIGKEIAKGLAAAHSRDLIHRDIKPSNVWLDATNKGRVKILDFGLARPTNEETHLTQEGMILGSPAYMSPEQARGENIDERVDLFSLGCVLYRLCAGRLPFAGKDAMSMLLAITAEEPASLRQLNGDVPAELADLIHQLLAKKPENRPASAKAVVQAIQNVERDWIANANTTATRPVRADASASQTTQDATIDQAEVDPALEESAITDLDLQPTHIPGMTPKAPPRNRSWIFAGLGCSALTVVSLLCCVALLSFPNHGFVQVTVDEDALPLLEDGEIVLIDNNKGRHPVKVGEELRLPSGGYRVAKLPAGVVAIPDEISLSRGETREINVRFAPPAALKPGAPEFEFLTSGTQARKVQAEWAVYLKQPIEIKTSLDTKLVLIPPGDFMMGSTKEQINKHWQELAGKFKKEALPPGYVTRANAEMPAHKVRIKKPFYLGMHEVTFGEFKRFVTANSYLTLPRTSKKGGTGIEIGRETPDHRPEFDWTNFGPGYTLSDSNPVSNIAWKDAEKFCEWLSKKEKKTYRLPTEAEWEFACRAGTTSQWSFGDDLRDNVTARNHMIYHVPFGLKFPTNPMSPRTIGSKQPNDFGLKDMHGNVAEMCSDYWDANYYQRGLTEKLMIAPTGAEPTAGGARVTRGGSFADAAYVARSASRSSADPTLGRATIGFRIVCEVTLTD